MWKQTTSPESAEFGGNKGYNFVTLGGVEFAKPTVEIFKDSFAKGDRPAGSTNGDFPGGVAVGIMRHVVVAETDEMANRIAQHAYRGWEANLTKLWRLNNVPGPKIAEFIPPTLEDAEKLGTVVVGTPAKVRDILAQHIEALGLNYMVIGFYFGDMAHENAIQSMETFATEIMPELSGL